MWSKATSYLANRLWVGLCKRKSKIFERSLDRMESTQKKILLDNLNRNSCTCYGEKHSFKTITTIEDFQNNLPLTTFDDYLPYIERMFTGEEKVLTAEPTLMFELSSGTTSASKYIPYTQSLKKEFQRGIAPWIYNLYTSNKGLFAGKSYWSITPIATEKRWTEGGIPIGFEEDGEYFGFLERIVLNRILTVPNVVKEIDDILTFRYVTLLFLLKEKNLTLISVWNPSFLILLLKPLKDWAEELLTDLATGEINPPGKIKEEIREILQKKLGKNRRRSQELLKIFTQTDSPTLYEQIWPNLKLISSWTDANATIYLPELKTYFPTVQIQGKGLLATEGIISIPRWGEEGAILTVNSHFFEFIEYNADTQEPIIKLASDLELGKVYSVIITTGGGFYRYQLHDLIQVVGFTNEAPRIKFVGKEAKVSDYFGEKINEFYLHTVLQNLFKKHKVDPRFYMVAPEKDEDGRYYYVLFIEPGDKKDPHLGRIIAQDLEVELTKNFHYKYCRQLEQLDKARVFYIDFAGLDRYLLVCQGQGQKLGDIKPSVLHTKMGWSKEFTGSYVECS